MWGALLEERLPYKNRYTLPHTRPRPPHSAYIFPISISGKKLGALTFGIAQGEKFSPDDVELMTSVSSHVGVALESAIATDAAETYQRQLARERDRLRLLLEINNQVVT